MKRMIKFIAVVLAGLTVAIVAYDRSRAHDDAPWFGSATLQPASATKTGGYRIEAAPKTVIDFARNRNGCTLTSAVPTQTVCDIAIASPDVGLDGTVTFVGSAGVAGSSNGLTIDLEDRGPRD